jgi:hypothetical protein
VILVSKSAAQLPTKTKDAIMAARTVSATKTTDAAGRRVKTKGEAPKANLLEKDISGITVPFTDYIESVTGYRPNERDVQLASVLRREFQNSEGNQARLAEAAQRKITDAEAREQRKLDREAAKEQREIDRAAKAEEREAAKAAKAAEPKPEKPAAKAKAAPAAKAKPAAKVAAKPAAAKPAARRRPAAKATDGDF